MYFVSFSRMISLTCLLASALSVAATTAPTLTQADQQLFHDRLWQTNLRGPRWSKCYVLSFQNIIDEVLLNLAGNDNQNTLTNLVSQSMQLAGLDVQVLNYTIDRSNLHSSLLDSTRRLFLNRWDPQWWSLSLTLKNGTVVGLPTTGYWPYSGDSGVTGVTAPIHDAGTFSVSDVTEKAVNTTLNLDDLPATGSVLFFDNPSPTHNYSLPGYKLLGYRRRHRNT
ncbi:hypothetical protein J3R30DRAFT_133788 [Lentinula aciculospora]|uniref:Uncharacterized protein n=1 Tax=Lentinula aciculospora TaxID=153920 RepID=A0A9W9AX36_9AGAR|nr:hypothetical protein J3R30DRAFT_133788 [Lentinula aciculospora]